MKKIRITITKELELPDYCELVKGPGGTLIKLNEFYLHPDIKFMQSTAFSQKNMQFAEISEEVMDIIFAAIVREKEDVSEI